MTSSSKEEPEWQALERLDEGIPAANEEEAALRQPYERLIEQLRMDEEDLEVPAGWEARLAARWKAENRRRWRLRVGVGAGLAAAAILALLLILRSSEVPTLEVAFATENRSRGDKAALGDTMHVRARAGRAVTLLVYLERELIATCPGSGGCRREGDVEVFELRLHKAGLYRLVRAQGASAAFSPGAGGYEAHRREARRGGVQWTEQEQRVSN